MGLREARKYIKRLHKKQENPYLWPNFLTGLPDKAAIIKKLEDIFPKLGKYAVSYVRIANIHPYLIKYGSDKHAEIIQWAAAILKTTAEKYKKSFVGTISTHGFIVICDVKNIDQLLKEAASLFKKKTSGFYSKEDLSKKSVLSFIRDGKEVNVGLMKLIAATADKKLDIKRSHLIQTLGRACTRLEESGGNIVHLSKKMISDIG
ncbi:MAG: hypothetical protein HZA07_02660 [Nitrospirae bacterium]|nr:hypothetical protein [Nitrospirota bacterium]